MESMQVFREVAAAPLAYGQNYRQSKDRPLMGYICSWVPEELILAGGCHPFRLFGTKDLLQLADAHLQSYCCSLVRAVLDQALAGKFSFLQGMIFPHTCDSIQRLSDIWRLQGITPFHADLVLPVTLNRPSAEIYLQEILARLKQEIGAWRGREVGDEELREAISLMNKIRQAMKEILTLKSVSPDLITARDLYALIRASFIMDRYELAKALSHLCEELKSQRRETAGAQKKRLLLAGGFCDLPELYGMVEEAGGLLVGDDLCVGARAWEGLVGTDGDPLVALARRYLEKPVCPAKHQGLTSRAEHLIRLVRKKQASGVIFVSLKFCDPHAFDHPYLKERLAREGIPSLFLEVEDQLPGGGQLQTRVEAFLETI